MKLLPPVPPERDFRRLMGSRLMTGLAGSAVPLLLIFTVLRRPNGAHELGWVLAVAELPGVLFLFVSGVVSDRLPRRLLVVVGDLLNALLCAAMGLGLLLGRAPLGLLIGAATLAAVTQSLMYSAYGALLPATVAEEHLQQANALRSVIGTTFAIAGPALASVAASVAPLALPWLLAAALYAGGAVGAYAVRATGKVAPRGDTVWQQMRSGWQYFRSTGWLAVMTAYSAVWHLVVWAPFIVLGAVSMGEQYGSTHGWGYVQTAIGLGGLATGLLIGRFQPRRTLPAALVGLALVSTAALAIGLGLPFPLVLAASLVSGAGLCAADVYWSSALQRSVPAGMLGQILSYDYLVSVALLPLGYALAPLLGSWLGVSGFLILGPAAAVLGVALVAAQPSVRRADEAPAPAAPRVPEPA